MDGTISEPKVDWDYTQHARHYDKRADYSDDAVGQLLKAIDCTAGKLVADVGAGTGKLTKELLSCGLEVLAVEPNEAMRSLGISNTEGEAVSWSVGTAESTGLRDRSVCAVLFGSSFDVVDRPRALIEAARVLVSGGWFACMWNHRDLEDPVQRRVDAIIKRHIPGYAHGAGREDPTSLIEASGLFGPVQLIEGSFVSRMSRPDMVEAWKSHATLRRQADSEALYNRIVGEISRCLDSQPEMVDVPYTTRIYYAQSLR